MIARLCARLATGPAAFLIGGLLDVGALVLVTWQNRWRRRRRDD